MTNMSIWQDEQVRQKNEEQELPLCERCGGTGNELFAMYRQCEDCYGTGVRATEMTQEQDFEEAVNDAWDTNATSGDGGVRHMYSGAFSAAVEDLIDSPEFQSQYEKTHPLIRDVIQTARNVVNGPVNPGDLINDLSHALDMYDTRKVSSSESEES